jgi:hypothetical protein
MEDVAHVWLATMTDWRPDAQTVVSYAFNTRTSKGELQLNIVMPAGEAAEWTEEEEEEESKQCRFRYRVYMFWTEFCRGWGLYGLERNLNKMEKDVISARYARSQKQWFFPHW